MSQLTVWNPKDLPLVEKPNARSQSLGVHQENLVTNLWKIVSTDTTIRNHPRICETHIYFGQGNLR